MEKLDLSRDSQWVSERAARTPGNAFGRERMAVQRQRVKTVSPFAGNDQKEDSMEEVNR